MPEVIELFHVTGADDFLLHIGVADTDALRDFVLDRLTVRPEVGHVESRVVYDHILYGETTPGIGVPQWWYSIWLPVMSVAIALRALGLFVRRGRRP